MARHKPQNTLTDHGVGNYDFYIKITQEVLDVHTI